MAKARHKVWMGLVAAVAFYGRHMYVEGMMAARKQIMEELKRSERRSRIHG